MAGEMQNNLVISGRQCGIFFKLNTYLSYDSAIPFSGLYPKEMKVMFESVHNTLIKNDPDQCLVA
jgi:hypothetical protein